MPKGKKETPKKWLDDPTIVEEVVKQLDGDTKLIDELRKFSSKTETAKVRREIDLQTSEVLAGELKDAYDEAIEYLNKIYRQAWSIACNDLGYSEDSYPSKY